MVAVTAGGRRGPPPCLENAILSPQLMLDFCYHPLLSQGVIHLSTDNLPPVFHNIYAQRLSLIFGLIKLITHIRSLKFVVPRDGPEFTVLG